jgi:ABC-type methionine transport system permease subunit
VPKTPSTIIPFLLGFFLGIFGVIIAVLVYNGNDGPYTKNPTTHALMWSLVGMLIWIPIMIMVVLSLMAAL